MSYCRFSSMNWKCDVYVYADVDGGWTTHVAARARFLPVIPDLLMSSVSMKFALRGGAVWKVWWWFVALWNRLHMVSVRLSPMREINLPYAGETFNDATALECAERLESLAELGYRVPRSAIDALREEA